MNTVYKMHYWLEVTYLTYLISYIFIPKMLKNTEVGKAFAKVKSVCFSFTLGGFSRMNILGITEFMVFLQLPSFLKCWLLAYVDQQDVGNPLH